MQVFGIPSMQVDNCLAAVQGEAEHTGTAWKGTVFDFNGYLSSPVTNIY
jgi:hypothetical protein